MDVLEHEHGRRIDGQVSEQRSCNVVRLRTTLDELSQPIAGRRGDIEEWPERPWREQGIARAPEDARRSIPTIGEAPQQRRLPCASLTGDQHKSSLMPF